MEDKRPIGAVAEEVQETLDSLGCDLVELAIQTIKRRLHVYCTVYHPDGVSIDLLVELHRVLEPRLELALDTRDIAIECSSPGIERHIKSFHEFEIFAGHRVSVLSTDASDHVQGTIAYADQSSLHVITKSGEKRVYKRDEVRKAHIVD